MKNKIATLNIVYDRYIRARRHIRYQVSIHHYKKPGIKVFLQCSRTYSCASHYLYHFTDYSYTLHLSSTSVIQDMFLLTYFNLIVQLER